jgi:hypothetical protein
MTRTTPLRWAILLAAPLLARDANAQPPRPSATPAASGSAAAKSRDGADAGPTGKAAEEKKEESEAEKQLKAQDRAARRKLMRGALKARLAPLLKAPIDDSLKAELKRNAETSARLLRIKEVALEQKDTASVNQATKLLDKETARHDKWMAEHVGNKAGAK